MRVDSVIAINDHQQHTPNTQSISASPGKSASGLIFEEYLKANLQQISSPTVSPQAENHIAGLLRDYFIPLKIAQKTESKQESSAS